MKSLIKIKTSVRFALPLCITCLLILGCANNAPDGPAPSAPVAPAATATPNQAVSRNSNATAASSGASAPSGNQSSSSWLTTTPAFLVKYKNNQRAQASVGLIGCPKEQIVISESVDYQWKATCKGQSYYCSARGKAPNEIVNCTKSN